MSGYCAYLLQGKYICLALMVNFSFIKLMLNRFLNIHVHVLEYSISLADIKVHFCITCNFVVAMELLVILISGYYVKKVGLLN